jgi:hypothetical protein
MWSCFLVALNYWLYWFGGWREVLRWLVLTLEVAGRAGFGGVLNFLRFQVPLLVFHPSISTHCHQRAASHTRDHRNWSARV